MDQKSIAYNTRALLLSRGSSQWLNYWSPIPLVTVHYFFQNSVQCTPSWRYRGHSKNNEANVLQNGRKIIYLWYISTSFFLITRVSHHCRIISLHAMFLSCLIIFGMTHKYLVEQLGTCFALLVPSKSTFMCSTSGIDSSDWFISFLSECNLIPTHFIYFLPAKISLMAAPLNWIMIWIIEIEWGLPVNQIHSCL